jgi:putative heme iron utilization protein
MSTPLERAQALAGQLRQGFKTIILGTATTDGEPDTSPVAAILDEAGRFGICVSGLAVHTRHLLQNRRASVLLAEDEANTQQGFARRRLTFACTAEPLARESAEAGRLIAALRAKYGATVDVVASLPDFQPILLTPHRGRLVAGFGEAYDVDPRDWTKLSHVGRPFPAPKP